MKVRSHLVEVGDPPEGANPWTGAAPVTVSAVLARPQVVGSSPVVGLVIQEPVAINHIAGVNVGHAQAVLDVGAVVTDLLHLAGHVWSLVQPYFVGTTVLQKEQNLSVFKTQSDINYHILLCFPPPPPCHTHHWNHTTGSDAVIDTNHALVVRVLPPAQEVLVAQVVGSFIDHKTATFHSDRVAAVEVGVKVSAVAHALMMPTLEISVFVEYDLKEM